MSDRPEVHLNLNVRGMGASATVAINERCNAMLAAGEQIFKLGLGQSPFPVPESVVQALRDSAHEKDYLPVRGLRALRDRVADYHRRGDGIECSGDDVLVGPGSKELMFLLQLVYYGDLVIPAPAWVSYAPQARIIGRQVHMLQTLATDGWRLRASALDALCRDDPRRPRVVILNYPSNPTGATYSEAELREIADVAKRYRLVLLSDEIYGQLHHAGQHISIARFYPEGTIVSAGLSKWCGAGGWRLGTFLFPPNMRWLLDAMATAASETYTSTCAPIQFAAVRAFEGGLDIEDYLAGSRRVLRSLGGWVHQTLAAAGVSCAAPVGGFYLLPDFESARPALARRGITTSPQLCEALLADTGVAILPGVDFGRPAEELLARLAYVDFNGANAIAALDTCGDNDPTEPYLRQHCSKVLEATERICNWVEGP